MNGDVDSDCSPVKLSSGSNLEVKPNLCLICGKWNGSETLRKPLNQGISCFVQNLSTKGTCRGFAAQHFIPWFNLEEKTTTRRGQR